MKLRNALAAVAAATMSATLLVGGSGLATAEPTADAASLEAKQALDAIEPTDAATLVDGIAAANKVLEQLGITPFTPTLGACTDLSFPLAVAGAVPGPYTPGLGDLTVLGLDLNAVKKGEIMYGFVPVGVVNDSADKSGMRVAWFNTSTFQGGLGAPMSGITDTILDAVNKRVAAASPKAAALAKPLIDGTLKPALNLIPQAGVRGGLVDTGSGTVLSAIYGTVDKGDATCFFFPSLGIATAE